MSPHRDLCLDVNDFDETLPDPWKWDVKRLASSLQMERLVREQVGGNE